MNTWGMMLSHAPDFCPACSLPHFAKGCCCAQLVDEAWQRWQAEDAANADDVTAVVVAFTHSTA